MLAIKARRVTKAESSGLLPLARVVTAGVVAFKIPSAVMVCFASMKSLVLSLELL